MNASWQQLVEELVDSGYLKTPRIIEAFKTIDRKDFVLPEYETEAYGNYPLPIGGGQTISQPLTVAFMLELLGPEAEEKILDVGSGSGWVTALLAEIVGPQGAIIGVERITELCGFGKENLKKYFPENRAKIFCGDATSIVPAAGPFDKVIAGAAASKDIPEIWREALKIGGVVVAPIANSIWRFTKKSEDEWQKEEFPGFAFVPLISGERALSARKAGGPPAGERTMGPEKKQEKAEKQRARIFLPLWLFIASVFLSSVVYAVVAPLKLLPQKIEVAIEEGSGAKKIGGTLKEKKVVRSKWLFIFWTLLSGQTTELKHGIYQFENKISIPKVVERLAGGERFSNETIITIPEGWNLDFIGDYLQEEGIVSKEQFFAVSGEPQVFGRETEALKRLAARFTFLKERPIGASLEGYLFPDTYRVFRNAPAEEIATKMLANFDKKITPDLLAEIKRQGKTLYEIVTMASLIEKEVISEEDRSLISGILWKRNGLGIGLHVDATVSYLTGRKTTKILLEELGIDSPYNTYKYRGLPIGPITNPGLSAIRAAVFPKSSPYLYYLSAPDGRTIFSKTLEEHNLAKAKYLK